MTRTAEMLIIGAIIGTIGLVSSFAILSARSHTRDVTRLANVREMQMALELYFQGHSTYPIVSEPIALGQARTACLSQDGFSGPCPTNGPTPYLEFVMVPPAAGLSGDVSCETMTDVYCYRGSEDAFRIEFELEGANVTLGVASGVNCLTQDGFSAGACAAL